MINGIYHSLILITFSFNLIAQVNNDLMPSNTYQSTENPYYWKNRKPYEGYWQQDIHYKIKADLNEKTDIVSASEELTYWNNSPDDLPFVYFHLYSNAQVAGSYLEDLYKNNNSKSKFGKYGAQGWGTKMDKIYVDGQELKTELDNTILKVFLNKPLRSGNSITFKMEFKTYFDSGTTLRNRMKIFNSHGYKHYDLVHWYPRISVYDSKFGWDTHQHLDHEFYGDFGTYDVEINFANNYILDGTGILLNRDEVLPAELRQKLDIKNFRNKPLYEAPSEIIKADGSVKTWRFHADNVHDFALTADPTYRIGEAEWNGVKCIALAQESHAARWQNAAEYTAKVIQTNSEEFGKYAYPKMIVADAQDGMEYPMLTLDGGLDPDYRSLLIHEISHNWFFGMVGSNETYRAALDEGFTQFLNTWTYEKIEGKEIVRLQPKSDYVKKFYHPASVRNSYTYNSYMIDAATGKDAFLNTHSDEFGGAVGHGGGYRQVYYKTATMLYNLQYVLGDDLFLKAMQHYVEQWKMCHPYFEDFRNSVIQYTHVDLNWFFDQWMETTKTIDYKVGSIKKGEEKDQYIITLKRNGRMQMPIDFSVLSKKDSMYQYYIPNTWFEKKTDARILPRWIGWDKLQPSYKAIVNIPGGIKNVVIDPGNRLADLYMLDNSSKFPIKIAFDSKIINTPDWRKYELFIRPDLWYNGYDGLKAGIHFNGNYLNYYHVFDANLWYNTGVFQNYMEAADMKNKFDKISFRLNYKTATDKFMKNSSLYFSGKILDGLNSYLIGFDRKDISMKNRLYINFKSMYRADNTDLNYLLYPNEWMPGKYNSTVNIGLEHTYSYNRGNGNINLSLRSSTIGSDYDYSRINLTSINKNTLGNFNFNTRTILQYGTGKNTPYESALYASGANSEELMENKYTRSQGFINPSLARYGNTTNSFQSGGGLNLRGYAGYLLPEEDKKGNIRYAYKSNVGAAVNAELEFDKLFNIHPAFLKKILKLNTYFFGDAGLINYNTANEALAMSSIRADAGLGTAWTIKKWGPLQNINPLIIRFDMPLFLNRPPATDKNYFQFRWIVGINRTF